MRYRAFRRAERYLGLAVLAGMSSAAGAQETQASLSVSTGASVETNPYNTAGNNDASIAATFDVRPSVQWRSEQTTANLSGNAQFRQFTSRYGLEDNYSIGGNISTRVSERLTVFSNAGLSYSQGGFDNFGRSGLYPGVPIIPENDPALPVVVDPAIIDVSLLGRRTRTTALDFGLGANAQVSAYSTLSLTASGRTSEYRQSGLGNFATISGSAAYSHQLSDTTSIGLSGGLNRTDYRNTRVGDARTSSLSGTYDRRLGEAFSLFLSAGIARTRIDQPIGLPTSKFSSLTASARLCKRGELDSLCIAGSRSPQPSAIGNVRVNNTITGDYSRRLSERESISLNGSYARTGRGRGIAGALPGNDFASAALRYDNRLRDNLTFYAGTNFSKIYGSSSRNGNNYGVNIGLQYSFGVLR